MRHGALRSWSVATGIVAALAALTSSPAAALAPKVTSHIVAPDTLVAAGQTGSVTPVILTSGDALIDNVTFVVDARGVAGFATADVAGLGCAQAPADVWTCTYDGPVETGDLFYAPVFVDFTAKADAVAGTTGTIDFTFSADGIAGDTRSAKVTVGEGVDLGALPGDAVSAAVGGSFTVRHGVVNAGEIATHGAVAVFDGDYPVVATEQYSNCTYAGDVLMTCKFTDELAPGHSYALQMPYRVRADAVAPDQPLLENGWFTVDDFATLTGYITDIGGSIGTPGSGPVLALTDVTTAKQRAVAPPQTDVNAENNFADTPVRITGTQKADVAALGSTATGTVGAKVTVSAGITDNGPAAAYTHDPEDMPMLDVVVPAGLTVTAADEDCAPWEDGSFGEFGAPGDRHYRCLPFEYLAVGQEHKFTFTLRIDNAGQLTAPVKVVGWGEGDHVAAALNANTANDAAAIVVTAGGAPASSPGTGGQGGGLPVTGTPVAIVGGAGLLLAGAGFMLYRAARRRRLTEI